MRRYAPAVALALAALATHVAHRGLDAVEIPLPDNPRDTLPSLEAVKLLSLGYGELAADYYWLRAINHYGDKSMHALNYPNLAPLLDRVLALDPKFATGYVFAGTALTTNEMDPAPAMRLLRQGMEERPDAWRIPFLLGFNAYFYYADYRTAAEALGAAARLDGAPDFTAKLAARLAAEAGEPEIGIKLIEALLDDIGDPDLAAELIERRKLLIMEWQIKQLDAALARFAREQGHPARSFDELVQVGLLKDTPVDPLGGAYGVGPDGRTTTPHEDQRLRLAPEAKRTPRTKGVPP